MSNANDEALTLGEGGTVFERLARMEEKINMLFRAPPRPEYTGIAPTVENFGEYLMTAKLEAGFHDVHDERAQRIYDAAEIALAVLLDNYVPGQRARQLIVDLVREDERFWHGTE